MRNEKILIFCKEKLLGLKNIFILFAGNSTSQLITFLIAPVLSRLYSPAQFGTLAIFLAIGQTLVTISSMGYEAAIVVAKKDHEAVGLVNICSVIMLLFCVVLYIPIIIFNNEIVDLLKDEAVYPWMYAIPIYVFLGSFFNILNYFNIRLKEYIIIAKSNIIKSLSCGSFQFLGGIINIGSGGLILGFVFMNLFGNLKMVKTFLKVKQCSEKTSVSKLLLRYKKFPLYYVWGVLANSISLNIANVLINRLYSLKDVGYYSYAYRYIAFPVSLIGTSIGQVYFQELVEAKLNGNERKIFVDTFFKLLFIGIPLFGLMYFVIVPVFAFVFGAEWRVAGEYAQILIPLFFIRFIVSPLSMTMVAFEKQKTLFIWQIGLLIVTVIPYYFSKSQGYEMSVYLNLFTAFSSFYYIIYLIIIVCIIFRPLKKWKY